MDNNRFFLCVNVYRRLVCAVNFAIVPIGNT